MGTQKRFCVPFLLFLWVIVLFTNGTSRWHGGFGLMIGCLVSGKKMKGIFVVSELNPYLCKDETEDDNHNRTYSVGQDRPRSSSCRFFYRGKQTGRDNFR